MKQNLNAVSYGVIEKVGAFTLNFTGSKMGSDCALTKSTRIDAVSDLTRFGMNLICFKVASKKCCL